MGRQVGNGQPSQLSASSRSSTQNNTQQNSNFSYGSSARHTASSHMPHQYADISIDADDFTDGDFMRAVRCRRNRSRRYGPCRMILRKHRRRFLRSPQDRRLSRTAHLPFKEHRMLQVHRASTTHRICRKCKFIVPCRTILLHRRRRNIARKNTSVQPQSIEHSTQTEKNGGTHGRSPTHQSGNTAASRRNS